MKFEEAIRSGFINYVNFQGRASRAEFWYWVLFLLLISSPLDLFSAYLNNLMSNSGVSTFYFKLFAFVSILKMAVSSAVAFPSSAILVRRLHDINISGSVLFIGYALLFIWLSAKVFDFLSNFIFSLLAAYFLVIFLLCCKRGDMVNNRFG